MDTRIATERIAAGAASGMVATIGMSALMLAAQRLGLMGRMPPRKITERLLGRISPRLRRSEVAKPASLLAHFGFGAGAGALFGLLAAGRRHPTAGGVLFGLLVYGASYLGWAPAADLMPPARRDRKDRQASMAAAHVVFGALLGSVLRRLV